MAVKDQDMLEACIDETATDLFKGVSCEYPLDNAIVDKLRVLSKKMEAAEDDFYIFRFRKEIIDPLWESLIEKAIKCLRYFDEREPFKKSKEEKHPNAYGMKELRSYYDKYADFERMLYGSSQHYRDHVVHVFRTWLSGVSLMVKNGGQYLEHLSLKEKDTSIDLSNAEKLSMWTIIALTHDLGYPLQKAKSIVDATQKMVSTFVTAPDISMDLSFHGVQNYMNDFIVRLISSKMIKYKIVTVQNSEAVEEKKTEVQLYAARLQPKYYFKFQKSLENNSHGILSTLIIYKLLTYFLESDYSINEDYTFEEEDRRQFYIRREILRAIASHTCNDIYQLYMTSFSFLLRICDDTQEWGRKNISNLYVTPSHKYELKDISFNLNSDDLNTCAISEEFRLNEVSEVISLIQRLQEQALVYVTVFRDGQDTIRRDFSFEREVSIRCDDTDIVLTLKIPKDKSSELIGHIKFNSNNKKKILFGPDFFRRLPIDWPENVYIYNARNKKCEKLIKGDGNKVLRVSEETNKELSPDADCFEWVKGVFSISLSQ